MGKKKESEVEYNERLIQLWENKIKKIEDDIYNETPVFSPSFTKQDKLNYCNNLMNKVRIDLEKLTHEQNNLPGSDSEVPKEVSKLPIS